MKLDIPKHIQSIPLYEAGKGIEGLERELGVKGAIKLASNENPWGASPKVVRALRTVLSDQHRYPDGSSFLIRSALSKKTNLKVDEIVCGNGSGEIVELLIKTFVKEGTEVISSSPSFSLYQQFVEVYRGTNFVVPLRKDHCHDLESILLCISDNTRLIFLDNPNNPTGTPLNPGELYTFLSEVPESVIVVLDEAYVEFMDKEYQVDVFSLIRNSSSRCGVVVLRTFSKLYGLAGLRVGYGLMSSEIAGCLQRVRQPFNVNKMAQAAVLAALEDNNYYDNILELIRKGRDYLVDGIEKTGCTSLPSQANFLLVDVGKDAKVLYEALLAKGIIVRSLVSFGLPNCVRVSVGTEEENRLFLDEFSYCVKKYEYV